MQKGEVIWFLWCIHQKNQITSPFYRLITLVDMYLSFKNTVIYGTLYFERETFFLNTHFKNIAISKYK